MIIRANATINLAMNVGRKNQDGYHDVDIVSIPIDLHDVLEAKFLVGTSDTYLTEDDPTIICEETDLAYKAFAEMKKRFVLNKGVRIQLFKRIPPEAGLGGGYADAAAVIDALCRIYGLDPNSKEVIDVANGVSVNVARYLLKVPLRAKGRGEVLETLPDLKFSYGVLIVKPQEGLDTKRVFEEYDSVPEEQRTHADIEALLQALKKNDLRALPSLMVNSLTEPAIRLCPQIKTILSQMKELGFPLFLMSGSGSACFGLSQDKKLLRHAESVFESMGMATILTTTQLSKAGSFDLDLSFGGIYKKVKNKLVVKKKK